VGVSSVPAHLQALTVARPRRSHSRGSTVSDLTIPEHPTPRLEAEVLHRDIERRVKRLAELHLDQTVAEYVEGHSSSLQDLAQQLNCVAWYDQSSQPRCETGTRNPSWNSTPQRLPYPSMAGFEMEPESSTMEDNLVGWSNCPDELLYTNQVYDCAQNLYATRPQDPIGQGRPQFSLELEQLSNDLYNLRASRSEVSMPIKMASADSSTIKRRA
jgi:hypothetical protein